MKRTARRILGIGVIVVLLAGAGDGPGGLEADLAREGAEALARAARRDGDARRGAKLFDRPGLACATCHAVGGAGPALGPDLAAMGRDAGDVYIIESILNPSKTIKRGFETITISTQDGRTFSGLLAEDRPEQVVLRDLSQGGQWICVAKADIAEWSDHGPSLMPSGLVNALASRAEFLDLAKFLFELAAGGPRRAQELRPASALASFTPPDFERDIDHAGLIADWDRSSFERGAAIYHRVCANCHGTRDRAGSLPTAPRFATSALKNGPDPYAMYRTLTYGFGLMAPQTWMVPRQKYDVIHYIREAYFKEFNPSQYVAVDRAYLDHLPRGTSRGPAPRTVEPWVAMDYGPSLTATYEISHDGSNFAYKGVAIRLDDGPGGVSRGRCWVVFDHDTMRLAAAWTGAGFIDWRGINFNGEHQVHPRLVGRIHFANPIGPGWADPATGTFDDARPQGRDGHPYGPLPRRWAHYRGRYQYGHRVVLAYSVGHAEILELPGAEVDPDHPEEPIFTRTLEIGPSEQELLMRVAPEGVAVALIGDPRAELLRRDGFTLLRIPESSTQMQLKLFMSLEDEGRLAAHAGHAAPPEPLRHLTAGGPRLWPEPLATPLKIGRDDGPFAVDEFTLPRDNPWLGQLRLTGFDFLPPGGPGGQATRATQTAAVCTWDGDVWLVDGIADPVGSSTRGSGGEDRGGQATTGTLRWRRIAAGLFQPLGLKVREGRIYVNCRDQIVILNDLNGDGETDFYENFNSDHQVTEHFHEFAMDLQTDAAGNFYYAKAARHGLPAVVPQHGTLLRVSNDGARTEVLATGFRAPNGVCLNGDGTFFLTDQEGFWTPKNRINWVRPGHFYGNMWGYHDVADSSDAAMEPPVCWITNSFDRSPAELLWVTSDAWGPLKGSLLNFSYGYGRIYVVPHERVGDLMQGGMCALPIPPLPTGVMRGRFHPENGQLYTCGMFAWAGNQTEPGGFYRIRYTGKPVHLPIGLHAVRRGLRITFSAPLDPQSAQDASRYAVKVWSLKRTENYGSEHFNEHPLAVAHAALSADGRTVSLAIPEIAPTWCMEIGYDLRGRSGEPCAGVIHNTIHRLGE
jgi:putative heme-binding domain-containing protein